MLQAVMSVHGCFLYTRSSVHHVLPMTLPHMENNSTSDKNVRCVHGKENEKNAEGTL